MNIMLFWNMSKPQPILDNPLFKGFFYPTCRSIKRMKDKNKLEFTGTRDDVLARGYSPCMICNP